MISKLSVALGLASLAMAVPAAQEPAASAQSVKRQDDRWNDILDPWGQYGNVPEYAQNQKKRSEGISISDEDTNIIDIGDHSYKSNDLLRYAKRASVRDFDGYIPNCDSDPSAADTPKPQWPVNHGVKIPKHGNDDQCTTGHGADHCWTEYYLVEYAIEYMNWQSTGTVLQCSEQEGSTCSVTVSNLKQTCAITGEVTTEGWDQKVADVSFGLSVGKESWPAKGDIGYGFSFTKSQSVAKNDLLNRCAAETTMVQCSWAKPDVVNDENRDQLCHQVWYADRVQHVWGQAQRVCNKCSNGNVQQNSGDGNVCVRGQKEFEFLLPINKLVSCQGLCSQRQSDLPIPENTERIKYEEPSDWGRVLISPKLSPEDDFGKVVNINY